MDRGTEADRWRLFDGGTFKFDDDDDGNLGCCPVGMLGADGRCGGMFGRGVLWPVDGRGALL